MHCYSVVIIQMVAYWSHRRNHDTTIIKLLSAFSLKSNCFFQLILFLNLKLFTEESTWTKTALFRTGNLHFNFKLLIEMSISLSHVQSHVPPGMRKPLVFNSCACQMLITLIMILYFCLNSVRTENENWLLVSQVKSERQMMMLMILTLKVSVSCERHLNYFLPV